MSAEPAKILKSRGIVTQCRVIKVYDGDTVTVQPVLPEFHVRLLDCWAPEVKGKGVKATEKVEGFRSRDNLKQLLPEGSMCLVEIPTTGRLDKSLTFGRILAKVYNADGVDVSEAQVASGHATKTK